MLIVESIGKGMISVRKERRVENGDVPFRISLYPFSVSTSISLFLCLSCLMALLDQPLFTPLPYSLNLKWGCNTPSSAGAIVSSAKTSRKVNTQKPSKKRKAAKGWVNRAGNRGCTRSL